MLLCNDVLIYLFVYFNGLLVVKRSDLLTLETGASNKFYLFIL